MIAMWIFVVTMAFGTPGVHMTQVQFAVGPYNSLAECGAAQVAFTVTPATPGTSIGPWSKTPCYQKP
jgi:hypothetical protein